MTFVGFFCITIHLENLEDEENYHKYQSSQVTIDNKYIFNPLLSHVMIYIKPINYIKDVLIKYARCVCY